MTTQDSASAANRYRGALGGVHGLIDEARGRINPPPTNVFAAQDALSGAMSRLETAISQTDRFITGRQRVGSTIDELEYRLQLFSGQRQPAEGELITLRLSEPERLQVAVSLSRLGEMRQTVEREQQRYADERYRPQPDVPPPAPQRPLPPVQERQVPPLPPIVGMPEAPVPAPLPQAPASPIPQMGGRHPWLPWWGTVDCSSCHAPAQPQPYYAPGFGQPPGWGWRR
jgi:hypothetical protein